MDVFTRGQMPLMDALGTGFEPLLFGDDAEGGPPRCTAHDGARAMRDGLVDVEPKA
jgi:hypothetical protein